MTIDPQRVEALYVECLAEDLDLTDPRCKVVEGIMHKTGFDTEKLEAHREEIVGLLSQLPLPFHTDIAAGGGGGWSFLNACDDRDGNLWGSHSGMDQLFQLGMGLGIAKYLLPRDTWPLLPGGMPYVSVSP